MKSVSETSSDFATQVSVSVKLIPILGVGYRYRDCKNEFGHDYLTVFFISFHFNAVFILDKYLDIWDNLIELQV